MERNLEALAAETFDVVVVGGGVTGAAIAWDATLRGLSVALLEKGDFGSATSAASSKLIHGGIRYLQQGLIHKVRESIAERRAFLRIAPHLVHPLPFVIPTYGHGLRGREVLSAGLALYDALTVDRNRGIDDPAKHVPRSRRLGRDDVLELGPDVPRSGLTGGGLYYDAQMRSSERTTLAFVLGAARHGAQVASYAEVDGWLREGPRVIGVSVNDREGGERFDVRGRLVLNVTGPWAVGLDAGGDDERSPISFSKGVHVLTEPIRSKVALAVATRMPNEAFVNRGGRHIFLIPWNGHTLIGTTNVPFDGRPDELSVTDRDIEGFVEEISAACPAAEIDREDVRHAYAGLYPLIDVRVREGVYQGSGEYRIRDHAAEGTPGWLTVIGAKFTTARRLAEKAVTLAFERLGKAAAPCRTTTEPLPGGEIEDYEAFRADGLRRFAPVFGERGAAELLDHFGTEADQVAELAKKDPVLAEPVTSARPTPRAAVVHSARREMTLRLSDLVFRRTAIGAVGHPGESALGACASILGVERGWTRERTDRELADVRAAFPVRES